MPRDLEERATTQGGTPRRLHPFELTARLWERHVDKYYRYRNGRHGNRPDRGGHQQIWRPLSSSDFYRRRNCLRNPAPQPGAAFCRTVCGKGGSDEGTWDWA